MFNNSYSVEMEVAGDFGMFTRPDSGANPTSFCIPTLSAAKSMIECVCLLKEVIVFPFECMICNKELFYKMSYNTHSPLLKKDLLKKTSNEDEETLGTRIFETVLYKPVFRLKAMVFDSGINTGKYRNPSHAYMEQFNRHLIRGDFRTSVSLGQEQFLSSYCGPFREGTSVNTSINRVVKNVPVTMWDKLVNGTKVQPRFTDVTIRDGIARYMSFTDIKQVLTECRHGI